MLFHLASVNPKRSGGGGGVKTPRPIFCPDASYFGATMWCVRDFFKKNCLTQCGKYLVLIGGQDLAARGVSKFKDDMIFIIFREFNMML